MIDLQRFCANESDEREHLRAPWRNGAWTYATNGHVCVRVHASVTGPGQDSYIAGKHPNAGVLFTKWFDEKEGEFLAMPQAPKADDCNGCDGTGRVHAVKCTSCNEGTFLHCGLEYECQACAGSPAPPGWVETEDTTQPTKACDWCLGRGFRMHQVFRIGAANWDLGYINWLAALPQLRVRTQDGNDAAAAFLFDGGQALLMPRRD